MPSQVGTGRPGHEQPRAANVCPDSRGNTQRAPVCSKQDDMASSRAIELMRELMQEVGVAGALLPTKDGGLEAQLSLDVSDIPEEVLQDIFLNAPSSSFLWIIHIAHIADRVSLFVNPCQQEEEGAARR